VASLLAETGVAVVAVSTVEGAIYNPAGLDVDRLLALRREHGDTFVHRYPEAEAIEKEQLLGLEVDLLVPCARVWSVHRDNVGAVRAWLVVAGANAPVTPAAEEVLARKGIVYIPGFVANCGGILSSRMNGLGFDDDDVRQVVESKYAARVARLLDLSERLGVGFPALARAVAWRNVREMDVAIEGWSPKERMQRLIRRLGEVGFRGVWERVAGDLYASGRFRSRWTRSAALSRFVRRSIGGWEIDPAFLREAIETRGVEGGKAWNLL
jgi:glutamate dehydrogenase/leucine dehydrogenase